MICIFNSILPKLDPQSARSHSNASYHECQAKKKSWQAKWKQVIKVKISYFCEFYKNLWPCE